MVAFSTCNPQTDALKRVADEAFFPTSTADFFFLPSLRTVYRRSGRSAPRWRRRGPLRTGPPSRRPQTPCCCCSRCPPTLPASSWKTASHQLCAPGSSTCTQMETLGTSPTTSPPAHPSAPASAAPTPTPAPLCGWWWWRAASDCRQCPVTRQRKLGSLRQLVPLRSAPRVLLQQLMTSYKAFVSAAARFCAGDLPIPKRKCEKKSIPQLKALQALKLNRSDYMLVDGRNIYCQWVCAMCQNVGHERTADGAQVDKQHCYLLSRTS